MLPVDFADPDFRADPYPTYAALREHAPLHWHEPLGLFLVSRHADVNALLRDRRLGRVFTPYQPAEQLAPWNLLNERSLLELEPPEHTRLRARVAKAFTPRRVEGLRGAIAALTEDLLDRLDGTRGGDLIAGLAEPLPVAVIAELLGIPEPDRDRLRPWSNAITALYEPAYDDEAVAAAVAASVEFDGYLRALLALRRRAPGADLLSALAGELDEDELVATGVLLLNAGHEATVNVLGNGVLALLRHPDQLARLRADPGLVPRAVEELIRYDMPLQLFQRTVFAPVEVAGRLLEPGQRVGLLLGAANRDPAAFTDPDRLDVGRADNPHVGFGAGIHFCLGAPLARLELQVALTALLGRFPHLELAEEPRLRHAFQFRGYRALRVSWA